jgi:tetratricopeptide (TPR) repeat protein
MNQFDQCLEMTAIAKDLDPEKQEAHHISAMALFELERYEEAKVGLLKALALATTNARATNIKQKIALCNSKIAKKQSKEVKKQTVQSAVPVETEEPVAETNSVKEEHGEESEKKGESQKEEESVLDAAVPAETKVQFDQMLTQLVKIVGDKEMSKWKAQFDVVLQTLRPIPKFENQEALQAVFHELFLTLEKTEAEKWKAVFSQSLEKIQSMPDAPSSPSAMKHKYEQVLHQLQDFTSAAETAKWKQEFSGVVSELENIVRGSTSTELKSHFKQVLEQLISSVNAPETAKWRSEFNKSLAELSKSSSTLSDSVVLVDKMDNLMSSAIFVDHQVNYRDLFETVLVELSASSQKQE